MGACRLAATTHNAMGHLTKGADTDNVTLWACQPMIAIVELLAHIDTTGITINASSHPSGRSLQEVLPPVSEWDIHNRTMELFEPRRANNMNQFVNAWIPMIDTLFDVDRSYNASARDSLSIEVNGTSYNSYIDGFFGYYLAVLHPESISTFSDPQELLTGYQKLYTGIAAQVVKRYLLAPGPDSFYGTVSLTRQRLRVGQDFVYPMILVLCILLCFAIAQAKRIPRFVFRSYPGSISYLAFVLSASPDLNDVLAGKGHHSTECSKNHWQAACLETSCHTPKFLCALRIVP